MKKEIAQIISKKVYDDYIRMAPKFASTRSYIWQELDVLTKEVKEQESILDFGCGNGRLANAFIQKPISYIGMDPCPFFIEEAKQKYKAYDHIQFQVGDVSLLQHMNLTFNHIFCIAVLHHIPSKKARQALLRQLHHHVKPQGRLVLTVWNIFQPKYRYSVFEYMKKKLFLQRDTALKKEGLFDVRMKDLDFFDTFIPFQTQEERIYRYVHAFTKYSFMNEVKKAGFQIQDCYYTHKDKKTSIFQGHNIVIVAKKTYTNTKITK